jgi:hypothetical protein
VLNDRLSKAEIRYQLDESEHRGDHGNQAIVSRHEEAGYGDLCRKPDQKSKTLSDDDRNAAPYRTTLQRRCINIKS